MYGAQGVYRCAGRCGLVTDQESVLKNIQYQRRQVQRHVGVVDFQPVEPAQRSAIRDFVQDMPGIRHDHVAVLPAGRGEAGSYDRAEAAPGHLGKTQR